MTPIKDQIKTSSAWFGSKSKTCSHALPKTSHYGLDLKHTTDTSLGSLSDLLGGQGRVEVQGHQEGDLGGQGLELGLVGQSHLGVGDGGLQVGLSVARGYIVEWRRDGRVREYRIGPMSSLLMCFSMMPHASLHKRNAGISEV